MKVKYFFITGVTGAGKSSVIEPLKKLLDAKFELHDFDERGVPENVNIDWRVQETKHWLDVCKKNKIKGISTIICGFSVPDEIGKNTSLEVILLDLHEKALRKRHFDRYSNLQAIQELYRATSKTPYEFVQDSIKALPWLRQLCKEYGAKTIDASEMSPQQIAEAIRNLLF